MNAATGAVPVVTIDGHPIANGAPGSVALDLRRAYHEATERRPLARPL